MELVRESSKIWQFVISWRLALTASAFAFCWSSAQAQDAMFIDVDGKVGMGTNTPQAQLHILNGGDPDGPSRVMLFENNGAVQYDFTNTAVGATWRMVNLGVPNAMVFTELGHPGPELTIQSNGDLLVQGNIFSGGTQLNVPDYVFEPSYQLQPLSELKAFIEEEKHLPGIPSAAEIAEKGVNMSQLQMQLLEKIEQLTLYTVEQQAMIEELKVQVAGLQQSKDRQTSRE